MYALPTRNASMHGCSQAIDWNDDSPVRVCRTGLLGDIPRHNPGTVDCRPLQIRNSVMDSGPAVVMYVSKIRIIIS